MLLSNILKDLREKIKIDFKKFNPFIKGIQSESKKISKNFIFVAIKGKKNDGHKFIQEAVNLGAIFIVIENKNYEKILKKKKINFICTKNSRNLLSKISSNFYKNQPKTISAVTGTNGKTSVAFITNEILRKCNYKSAFLGTLGLIGNNYKKKLNLTTENSTEIHKNLEILKKKNVNYVCLEASSHGLDQHRLDNINLKIAAFTNISQDHFDYHKNFKNYFNSKMLLFSKILKKEGVAIINSDLEETKKILSICKKKNIKTFTYGYNSNDLRLIAYYQEKNFQKVIINFKNKILTYKIPIIGDFQVYNSLCAICIAFFSGVQINKCLSAIQKMRQIPGRLERINIKNSTKKNFSIFVDYAHTPDALEKVLKSLKKDSIKLSLVFGCGGDRDKSKRPLMGKVANEISDKVYVTDDNPRKESAKKIRSEIILGCPKAIEIQDRYLAIKKAINNSDNNEILLIAGKGHEDYQIIGEKIYKFSDKNTVLKLLKKK